MRFRFRRTSPAGDAVLLKGMQKGSPSLKSEMLAYPNEGDGRGYFYCRNIFLAVLLTALCLAACSDSEEWSDDKDRFVQTYNIILYEREKGGDTVQVKRSIDSALAAGGFTQQSFQEKYDEYSRNPNVLRRVLDSAQIRAQKAAQKK